MARVDFCCEPSCKVALSDLQDDGGDMANGDKSGGAAVEVAPWTTPDLHEDLVGLVHEELGSYNVRSTPAAREHTRLLSRISPVRFYAIDGVLRALRPLGATTAELLDAIGERRVPHGATCICAWCAPVAQRRAA